MTHRLACRRCIAPTRRLPLALAVALVALLSSWALAQEEPPPAPDDAAAAAALADPHDPTVPVGAVRAYIDACRAGEFEKAAERLDLSGLPRDRAADGSRLAWQLKIVLDRKLWVRYELLSAEPEGDLEDGLPADLDRLGSVEDTEILLRRVADRQGRQVWKFASSTVDRIPELYDRHGYGRLGQYLPAVMFETSYLEVQLWQWIGLLLLIPAALLVAWPVARLLFAVARPIVRRTRTTTDDRVLEAAAEPFRLLVALGLFMGGSLGLALAVPVQMTLGILAKVAVVVLASWFAVRIVDVLADTARENLEAAGKDAVAAVLPLGRRVGKVFLGVVALLLVLQNLGFDVTGLIAGLGIGGLAVALAAQKSVANLFGGVSLVADQPVRVGDFCRLGSGQIGTVEEIGLRSTRVRTLDRTLLSIPNAEFSEMQLENFAPRDRIRLTTMLNLRYETTPDQLRHVLAEIRKLLLGHPKILEDPARIRFVAFGAHSLDLEIFAYVHTTDWNEFLQIREDVFLRIMDIVEASGTGFAFPSQTLYLGRDGGLDEQKTRDAESRVRAWREENKLPFPDFTDEMQAELKGTLEYPPPGSAAAARK
jgi:MscS family membrane protein